MEKHHLSLGEMLDHPVTRVVFGAVKGLLGLVFVLAGIIGTSYVGEIKKSIEVLTVQLGNMDERVDALERESAVRAATYERDRRAYERYQEAWKRRNPDTASDAEDQP